MRRRHSLGGTDSLAEDPVAELRLHGLPHDQVHAAAEDLFQPPLYPEEVEQPDGPVEVDEQVHVAVRRGISAGYRTEDLEGANPELRKLGSLLGESALDVFARHARIIERPGRLGQPGVRRAPAVPLRLDLGRKGVAPTTGSPCGSGEAPFRGLVIQDHLQGHHVIGVYPLMRNERCHFLAIDFDKGSWADDVGAFAETCRAVGLPAALDRSRSGNGAHAYGSARSSRADPRSPACCRTLSRAPRRRLRNPVEDSGTRLTPRHTSRRGAFPWC